MHTLRGVRYAHVTHMHITWYCLYILYFADQNFQRSTIGYLSNSWASGIYIPEHNI